MAVKRRKDRVPVWGLASTRVPGELPHIFRVAYPVFSTKVTTVRFDGAWLEPSNSREPFVRSRPLNLSAVDASYAHTSSAQADRTLFQRY